MIPETAPQEWPDLQTDQRAWEQAQSELPNARLSDLAARAQEIKEAATHGAESLSGGRRMATPSATTPIEGPAASNKRAVA
jgi:hypothetical protein